MFGWKKEIHSISWVLQKSLVIFLDPIFRNGIKDEQRKEFIARRHKIAKMAAKGLMKEENMVKEFKDVFENHKSLSKVI